VKIAGVDPGGAGALALLDGTILAAVADMPVFTVTRGKGSKRELDVHGLVEILRTWAPDYVWFEQVGGMEGDAPSSAFNFGRIAGAAEALVKASGARFDFVAPHVWKREMGLIGKNKDDSRVMATNLWPAAAGEFRRKMDDGRAEAALIAEYGRRQLVKQGIFG
jgi:hypothetical protein